MRVAFLNWRDLTHPEGGGAERYAQNVCAGLARLGHDVTFFCAAHDDAPTEASIDGYRMFRQGGRLSVYPASLRRLRDIERREGGFDVTGVHLDIPGVDDPQVDQAVGPQGQRGP